MKKLATCNRNTPRSGCICFARLWLLLATVVLPKATGQVIVDQIVVPGNLEHTEGNSRLTDPFSFGGDGVGSVRMQQVYAASEFVRSPVADGGWIYGLSFRSDAANVDGIYTARIPSLQISLSVTLKGPDQLSPIFAENIGSDVAIVNSGSTLVQVVAYPDTNPDTFTGFFTFSEPYYYDPSRGNLLLDVVNIGGPPFAGLDATEVESDGVSRVYYRDFGTQIPSAGTVDTKGLVTRFTMVPVPEPSTWVLLGLGAVALAWGSSIRK